MQQNFDFRTKAVTPTTVTTQTRSIPLKSALTHRRAFVFVSLAILWATPAAIADITNTAKADGTPERGDLRSTGTTMSVPVEQRVGELTVTQDLGGMTTEHGNDPTVTDPGDSLWFRVRMKNTGNAPVENVWPTPELPTFAGKPGTGEIPTVTFDPRNSTVDGPEILGPGEVAEFYMTYILTVPDILRGAREPEGMQHRVRGTGDDDPQSDLSIVAYQLPADPHLVTTARVHLDERFGRIGDGAAAIGDMLTYTYFVENTGNVPIRGVTVTDIHEEADPHRETMVSTTAMRNERLVRDGPLAAEAPSSDRGLDGSWDILEPGGVVTFSITRTVGEAEILAQ